MILASALRDLHTAGAWVMVITNAVAGLWALGAHWAEPLRTRSLWWFTGFAEVFIFVQVALGVALMSSEDIEPDQFHIFYGFLTIIAVAIVYSYRAQVPHVRYLLYGGGGLFIMGLGIRAMFIGTT